MRLVKVIRKRQRTLEGMFIGWGLDCEEYANGSYTVAFVELIDGQVIIVRPSEIQFTNPWSDT